MKYSRTNFIHLLVVLLILSLSTAVYGKDVSQIQEIKIGAILPLTGSMAQIGAYGKHGFEMALDQIRKEYPAIGKKINFILEDNKSVPSESRSCSEKLVNKDKVFALTGDYASSTCYAALVPLKTVSEPPITILSGGTVDRIEKEFGQNKWFFHIHTWTYTYQKCIRNFLLEMKEPPKTIFLAYEDTDFGTTHARYAKEYLSIKGMRLIGMESFKTGAIDFTPLLTKAKMQNPDVFYWIGYGGDAIQITKQSKETNFNPKMFLNLVTVLYPSYATAVGEDAQYFVGNTMWEASANYPASSKYPDGLPSTQEFIRRYQEKYKGIPDAFTIMTYLSLYQLAVAINEVGLDREGVIDYLEKLDTMSPMGPFKYRQSDLGGIHQAFHDMVVLQHQNGKPVLIYPGNADKLVYPSPPWGKKWPKK